MAKITGVSLTTFGVDDSSSALQDIRNDVTDFDFDTPREVQDVTGVDKAAIERLLLLADGTVNINGVFNASLSHLVLKTIPSTSVQRTVTIGFGGVSLSMEMVGTSYNITRGSGGELTWKAVFVLANGTAPSWT